MDPNTIIDTLLPQAPLAAVALWVAKAYMDKHSAIVDQLVNAFKDEIAGCNKKYQFILEEFLKIKEHSVNQHE